MAPNPNIRWPSPTRSCRSASAPNRNIKGPQKSEYSVAGWALNAVTEDRDLTDIFRSTGQRVIGAADLLLQATQPALSVTDIALDALETDLRIQTDPTRWEAVADSVAPAPESAPGCTAVVHPR